MPVSGPYGVRAAPRSRHQPTCTSARFGDLAANSRSSRDLPMPGLTLDEEGRRRPVDGALERAAHDREIGVAADHRERSERRGHGFIVPLPSDIRGRRVCGRRAVRAASRGSPRGDRLAGRGARRS